MPLTTLEYRLRIRNEADSADLLVLSSRASDPNCLLIEAPQCDGQRIDPIAGRAEVGVTTWHAVDRDDGEDARTITALLADVDARNQLLSHKCVGEYSSNGGAWTAFHTGYLNSIRLSDPLVYELTVGDTDRREQRAELFREVTTTFDRVSCIIGGPIVATTPAPWGGPAVRSFGPQLDYGPARFSVIGNSSGGSPNPANLVNPTTRVTLGLVSGNLPPLYLGQQTSFSIKLPAGLKVSIAAEEIDRLARPYFAWDTDGRYATTSAEQSQPWGSFPGLEVRMTPSGGGAAIRSFPIAQATTKSIIDTLPLTYGSPPVGDYSALVANSNTWLIVDWDTATLGSQPSLGATFDVLVYPRAISAESPLHMSGHPIDFHTAANDQEGIPYDATSAAATKTALGAVWYDLRIKAPMKYTEFVEMLKGSVGYGTRYGADGSQEFFPTRTTQPASVDTVTVAEIVTDE